MPQTPTKAESMNDRLSHSDDDAVDAFAAEMKAKLADARRKGRGGWDNPELCTVDYLAQLLIEQTTRSTCDVVDVANFALFLFHRPGGTDALRARIADNRTRAQFIQREGLSPSEAEHLPRNIR